MGRTLQQAKTEHSRMVMMLKATPDDKPDAREKLSKQIKQLETEIKQLQTNPSKRKKKKSSGIDMTTVIIVLIGVIVVFGIALGTGIFIQ